MPQIELPSLRGFIGAIALTQTTAVTTVLELAQLAGGLTTNDVAVKTVVNAAIDAIESLVADGFSTLGQIVTKGGIKSSTSTGKTYAIEALAETQTENTTTPATIYSYTNANNCTIEANATVLAVYEDGTESYVCKVRASFNVQAGVVTLITSSVTPFDEEGTSGSTGLTATWDTSGGAIRLRVTGKLVDLWYWGAEVGLTVRETG